MATSPDQGPGRVDGDDENDETSHTQNPNPTQQQNDGEIPNPPPETLIVEGEETQQNPVPDDQIQDDPDDFNPSSPQPPDPKVAAVSASAYRRGSTRKKGAQKRRSAAQERKNRMKLETLIRNIKPIPFVPAKALDFASHEKLLQRLGLWNFVHLEFDTKLRVDLIAQLIANFNPSQRGSHVNGVRILVNRADMARALKLRPPGKKDKGVSVDGVPEVHESEESIAFVEDLVSNWMLLHEDMWMMPDEVLKLMSLIKEGHLEKVEWATLIWFMVEKELMLAPKLENCYYASHLQCLMKSQREELFEDEPRVQIDLKDDEEEEVDHSSDVKMGDAGNDFQVSVVDGSADVKKGDAANDSTDVKKGDAANDSADVKKGDAVKKSDAANDSTDVKMGDAANDSTDVKKGAAANDSTDVKMGGAVIDFQASLVDGSTELKMGDGVNDFEVSEVDASTDVKSGDGVNEFQVLEVDGNTDVKMSDGVNESQVLEVDGSTDVKMSDGVNEFQVLEMEEHKLELSLGGHDNVDDEKSAEDHVEKAYGESECVMGADDSTEKADDESEHGMDADDNVERADGKKECVMGMDAMDFDECKAEEFGQWFLDGKSNAEEHYLRRCNSELRLSGFMEGKHEEGIGGLQQKEEEEEDDDEEEEEHQDGGFDLSPNALSSDNIIQALEAAQNPFGSGLQLHDNSAGDFLSSRSESHLISDNPSLFGNAHKREYGNDNVISHGGANKRLRSDGSYDDKSCDFYGCMDQMQQLLRKARMAYETKEHSFAESSMNQQVLLNELQQRDNTIDNMHNQRMAEQHKREVDTYRLERELLMMGNLLQNYRKALKETQRAFAEYRARFPQPIEPLYKDVPGSGGLVLSTNELEKLRLKQLEEIRLTQMVIEKKVNDFEVEWITTFNGYLDVVHLLESKLLGVEKEVEHLKELSVKCEASKLPEATERTPSKLPEATECTPEE